MRSNHIEQKIRHVCTLDRDSCMSELLNMQTPKLDFSCEYLGALSIENLRHLLVAAYLQASKSACKRC